MTTKPFALGQGDDHSDTGRLKLRPVLTNLCVKKEGRKSGVGSALLEACEQAVTTWNPSYDEVRNNEWLSLRRLRKHIGFYVFLDLFL